MGGHALCTFQRDAPTQFSEGADALPETLTDGESGIQSEGKRGSGPNELSPPSIRIPSGLFPRLKRSLEEGIAVALDALTKMLVGELSSFFCQGLIRSEKDRL